MARRRILVAMSGGVDSSVVAALLLEQGHEVIGVTMNVWPELPDEAVVRADACCSLKSVDDAREVADVLGIPYYVLNLKQVFAERVIDNFYDEYAQGRTPNPCVRCNQFIKFDALWPKARALDCDAIATGHYARISQDEDGRFQLLKGLDRQKDQSYVLYTLDNAHLARTLMPMGGYHKDEVRTMARLFGLAVADKAESQEICFVHQGAYHDYVGRARPEAMRSGPIVDAEGALVGTHKGIGAYTVGQRRGLGLSTAKPIFVSRIDPSRNLLVVGAEQELYASEVIAEGLHLTSVERLVTGQAVQAKVRSRAEGAAAHIVSVTADSVRVRFEQPQRAVTPGQALVLYDGDVVLGGGNIVEAVRAAA